MTHLRKRLLFAAGMLGFASMAAMAQQAKPEEKPAPRTLKAKLNYTGTGTVDEKHKIFLFVFDSPDFMQGGSTMPVGFGSASAKDGTVTVTDLSASPVYIAVCYDPTGGYDGQSGPPPSGASMGVYAKTPGTPDPVKIDPGKTAEITVTFDDSFKMP